MPEPEDSGPRYTVVCSAAVAERLRQLQRWASRSGEGEVVSSAFRHIVERLQRDPTEVGELLYRLPAMRMQVGTVVLRSLTVHFAVCEDHPLVVIKGATLLAPYDFE